MNIQHVVVIGGGFGGLYTTVYLAKNRNIRVTLIDPEKIFVFLPQLPDIIFDPSKEFDYTISYDDLKANRRIDVVQSYVTDVDFVKKQVKTETQTISYDYIVMSSGSTPALYNTPGIERAFVLKSISDVHTIEQRLKSTIKLYKATHNKDDVTFVVVGAGPTGIEVAGGLADFCKQYELQNATITVFDSGGNLSTQMQKAKDKSIDILKQKGVQIINGKKIAKILDSTIESADKESFSAATVFWCAGVQPVSIKVNPATVLVKNHFNCDQQLRIIGIQNAFALGDCAAVPDPATNGFVPKLAQAAVKEAKVVSDNINALVNKELTKKEIPLQSFTFKPEGYLVSVGSNAVAQIGNHIFSGGLASWLRSFIYKQKMKEIKNLVRVVGRY